MGPNGGSVATDSVYRQVQYISEGADNHKKLNFSLTDGAQNKPQHTYAVQFKYNI